MTKTAQTIVLLLLIAMQLVFPFHRLADCSAAWAEHHGLPPVEDFDHRHVSNGLGQSAMLGSQAEHDGLLPDLRALPMLVVAELQAQVIGPGPISLVRNDALDHPLANGRALRALISSLLI